MLLDRFSDDDGDSKTASSLASLLLVVSAHSTSLHDGQWQFVIEHADGTPMLEAGDQETGDLNRLTLLAAVRGLEAIDGPSGVTLLSHNRYLIRSLTDSLPRWRKSDFVWDHFGRRIEVQHADLWRRIDRTLGIHDVQACLLTARMVSKRQAQTAHRSGRQPSGSIVRPASETDAIVRIDSAHQDNENATSRRPHFTTQRLASSDETSGSGSSDRLRHWLLQSAAWNCRRSAAVLNARPDLDADSFAIES